MVDVLSGDDWCNGVAFLSGPLCSGVLELQTFLLETCLVGFGIAMLVLSVLHGDDFVRMLFWEDFAVLDRLHGGVVMVLVHLAVNGGLGLLVVDLGDILVHDGWCNLLVYCGIMVTSLVPEGVILSVKSSFN